MKLFEANNYKIKCNENLKKRMKKKRSFMLRDGALFDLWCLGLVRFMVACDMTQWFPKESFPSFKTNPKSRSCDEFWR